MRDSAGTDASQKKIGVAGATAIGIGAMVGGGIFAVLGVAATKAGGATPIAFILGGVVAALTATSYSRLSVAYPSAGGTVAFVDRIFGIRELTGSLNVTLWVGYVATTALYASAFGNYTATLFPGGTNPSPFLVTALVVTGIAGPWAINLLNAALIAKTESWIVAFKLIILAVVIGAGVPAVNTAKLDPGSWKPPAAIIGAGMLIFVAYEGFELIANASTEVRNPRRTLPRAFGLATGVVICLYVLVAGVVVGSLSAAEITRSAEFSLAQAASVSLGSVGFKLVAVSAMLATLSAINATLYGAARLSFTLATEGELPSRFEQLTWTQPVGLHITAGTGLAMAVTLPLESISAVASAIFLLVFAVVNAAAFRSSGDIGANRWLAATGALACTGSLGVLLLQTGRNDPAAIAALAILLLAALGSEHLTLKHLRTQRVLGKH
ncbi:MAG: amino acid permease [Acidimicrobiia bacterium]|nr:amino acid permease [Acidimicrobiia bacterium]